MITRMRAHRLVVAVFACSSCSNPEPAMSAPTPPQSPILSPFTPLREGFSQVIVPGARPLTLGGNGATWWDNGAPITATLPADIDGYGARWSADGKALYVGLGSLDLATRSWHAEAALQPLNQMGPDRRYPVQRVAWFADLAHVALLTLDNKVSVAARGGRVRGSHAVQAAVSMAAAKDRVIVAASKLLVLDLDAKVIAEPAVPRSAMRVSEGAGMFAVTLAASGVVLVRPSDGAIVATWDIKATDAVPVPHGIVAIDFDGLVRVGCLDGNAIKQVAEVPSGAKAPIVQHVGDTIVVAGAGATTVRTAAFANSCR
jgi:hypothetical protein